MHVVNTPKEDAREAYLSSWERLDERGARHPTGRLSHTAWLVGDVLHVVDVWESQEELNAFMPVVGQVMEGAGMVLDGQPEVGELLNVVVPALGDAT